MLLGYVHRTGGFSKPFLRPTPLLSSYGVCFAMKRQSLTADALLTKKPNAPGEGNVSMLELGLLEFLLKQEI
ncbi:hypothetical protein N752_11675 [Desulforamulus aquiferis]|nr:hypothetical protein N752_11675 [Desulforamulus aquiferis]